MGRLDKDTEGLLLLTNDGELSHRLLSPKKHVDKTYEAVIDGIVGDEDVILFSRGVDIGDDTLTLPAVLKILEVDREKLRSESPSPFRRDGITRSNACFRLSERKSVI